MTIQQKKEKLKQYCMSIPISQGCIGCALYPHAAGGRGCVPSVTLETDIEIMYRDLERMKKC